MRGCARRARYPAAVPRFKSMGHPIADERLKDQRRFAALCVFVHDDKVVVVGRIINDGRVDNRCAMG